jgi:ribonuclease P protein component
MTPPKDSDIGLAAEASETPPAVSLCAEDGAETPVTLNTMRTRPEFLRAAQARRQGTGGFLLQGRDRKDGDPAVHVGFTASKKIGNAVARNRAKRRLRALAREVLAGLAHPGWDYVLVAKPAATIARDFADLRNDLQSALRAVHRETPPKDAARPPA